MCLKRRSISSSVLTPRLKSKRSWSSTAASNPFVFLVWEDEVIGPSFLFITWDRVGLNRVNVRARSWLAGADAKKVWPQYWSNFLHWDLLTLDRISRIFVWKYLVSTLHELSLLSSLSSLSKLFKLNSFRSYHYEINFCLGIIDLSIVPSRRRLCNYYQDRSPDSCISSCKMQMINLILIIFHRDRGGKPIPSSSLGDRLPLDQRES